MNCTVSPTPGLNPSDTAMLEAFIPGYSLISRVLISYLHIDLSVYIPYLVTAVVFGAAARYIYLQLLSLFGQHCVSTAEIRSDDEVYNYLMYWIAQQPFINRTIHFIAGTKTSGVSSYYYYYDEDDDDEDSWGEEDEYDDDGNLILDFDEYWARVTAQDRRKRLRFTPSEGRHYFWFKGRPLAFVREKEENNNNGIFYHPRSSERLYVSCIGRDTKILKELLHEAQNNFLARDGNLTVIYRGQKSGGCTDWARCMARAPRALSTVILDPRQKQAFIDDIKEYLHPRTRRWYSNRGIPYRRGYLFHGPPGTGKTSLCFAASGLLGLQLHLLNLSSRSLDEDELMTLFQGLPRRCIVLLEDVDCAGMSHKRSEEATGNQDDKTASSSSSPPPPSESKSYEKQDVSLSGLLNVIDGVAACEGRILVMTTNHPEKLDPALIRPGRVDMSIAFGYSTSDDIKQLFSVIYSTLEGDLPPARLSAANADGSAKASVIVKDAAGSKMNGSVAADMIGKFSQAQVVEWSVEFASRVPAGEFTPAEIQGYLLRHKMDPEGAIHGVEKWIEEVRLKRKNEKEKEERERREQKERERKEKEEREKNEEEEKTDKDKPESKSEDKSKDKSEEETAS